MEDNTENNVGDERDDVLEKPKKKPFRKTNCGHNANAGGERKQGEDAVGRESKA